MGVLKSEKNNKKINEEIILILNRVCNKEYNMDEKKKWLAKWGKVVSYCKIETNFK